MPKLSREEARLRFFGYLAANPNITPREYVQELGVPAQTLSNWKLEFNKSKENGKVETLLDVDEIIVDRIVTETAKEIVAATVPEPLEVDELTGTVLPASELKRLQDERAAAAEAAEMKLITQFKDSVHGLQALKQSAQVTASTLLNHIASYMECSEEENDGLTVKEITALSSALSSLQNAFFNKPVTNIQVNQTNNTATALSAFREKLKP